ncbi:hypothetical protein AOLI_G00245650 [Acnodon oligacanthus]
MSRPRSFFSFYKSFIIHKKAFFQMGASQMSPQCHNVIVFHHPGPYKELNTHPHKIQKAYYWTTRVLIKGRTNFCPLRSCLDRHIIRYTCKYVERDLASRSKTMKLIILSMLNIYLAV